MYTLLFVSAVSLVLLVLRVGCLSLFASLTGLVGRSLGEYLFIFYFFIFFNPYLSPTLERVFFMHCSL